MVVAEVQNKLSDAAPFLAALLVQPERSIVQICSRALDGLVHVLLVGWLHC